jgi:bifunctional DNA-binding transcriptional regulator/antitoxin component of YhaV-PrlF toxin-antitoxin module
MTQDEMDRLTAGTDNKSQKIRSLFDAGVPRADIARYLGITYQHVQNVLKRSNRLGGAGTPAAETPAEGEAANGDQVYTVRVGAGGVITLPAGYVARSGIQDGELLICREEDGGLTIMSRQAAVATLREIARQRMPAEAALLEALLDQTRSS